MISGDQKRLAEVYEKTVIKFIKMILKRAIGYSWYGWQRRTSSCWGSWFPNYFKDTSGRSSYNIIGFRTIDSELLLILELRLYYDDAGEELQDISELKARPHILELKVKDEMGRYRNRTVMDVAFKKEEKDIKFLFNLLKFAVNNSIFIQKDKTCFLDNTNILKSIMKNIMVQTNL